MPNVLTRVYSNSQIETSQLCHVAKVKNSQRCTYLRTKPESLITILE